MERLARCADNFYCNFSKNLLLCSRSMSRSPMSRMQNYNFLSSFLSGQAPEEHHVQKAISDVLLRMRSLQADRKLLETHVDENSKNIIYFPGSLVLMEHFLLVHSGINPRLSVDNFLPTNTVRQPLADTLFWSEDDCREFLAIADLMTFIAATTSSAKAKEDPKQILASWLANALIIEGSSAASETEMVLNKYKIIFEDAQIKIEQDVKTFLKLFEFPMDYIDNNPIYPDGPLDFLDTIFDKTYGADLRKYGIKNPDRTVIEHYTAALKNPNANTNESLVFDSTVIVAMKVLKEGRKIASTIDRIPQGPYQDLLPIIKDLNTHLCR